MEEARRLKEQKKQQERQEAIEFEQRLDQERNILKARQDYVLSQETAKQRLRLMVVVGRVD